MYSGQEFYSIINGIFSQINGSGPQFQVDCPRCAELGGLSGSDGKFNLEINFAKRVYRCWKCESPSFSGSLGKLIRLYGSNSDYDLYKSYASIYGSDYLYNENEEEYIQAKLPDEMILFSQMEENNLDHFEAYNYVINDRKLSRETILKHRLGFCLTGKYSKRIIIPSYDENGDINYFVGRSYDKKEKRKYLNPNVDKNRFIFNIGTINFDSIVFIVEGVFDMLSLPNSIPLLGKTISPVLYLKLKELKPKIIIVLDPDAWKNEINVYNTLQPIYDENNMLVLNLKGRYDIDEIRKNLGETEIIKLLYNARKLNNNDYFDKRLVNEKNNFIYYKK